MKWVVRLYILFVGIILTTTTGFGIAAFYPQPVRPVFSQSTYGPSIPQSCTSTPQEQASAECKKIFKEEEKTQAEYTAKQQEYDKKNREYDNASASYTRTSIFFGISIGALFAIIGLILIRVSHPVANGIMLAGVFTAVATRVIIALASLGATTTGTTTVDSLSFLEFGILVLLSVAVIVLGFTTLPSLEKKSNT